MSSKATLRSTAAGNVELTNLGSLLLEDVEAYDGSVTVTATGALSAALVRTLGNSDRNDIMLTTLAVGAGALTVDTLQTDDRGDIVLRSAGQIVQSSSLLSDAARDVANARKPAASPELLTHTLKADQLDARAGGAVTLSTQVQGLTLETTHAGSVTITQGSRDLVLASVNVADGSLTVTGSGGVELADVRLSSNKDSNDITVTAKGDIGVRYVSAGIHLLPAGDRPVIYDASAGAGTKTISVSLAEGVSGSAAVSAPDTANANHLRTIDLAPPVVEGKTAPLTVVEGKTYTVEFGPQGSPTHSYSVAATLADVAAVNPAAALALKLSAAINAGGVYTAAVDATNTAKINITAGAGTLDIRLPVPAGATGAPVINARDFADASTERTITLTGVAAVAGKLYSVTVGTDIYSYTAKAGDSIAAIASGLATAISGGNFPTLTALIPSALITSCTPTIEGPEIITLSMEIMALDNGTNQPLSLTYVSSENLT